jgi:hypothetical protein
VLQRASVFSRVIAHATWDGSLSNVSQNVTPRSQNVANDKSREAFTAREKNR